jgi:hypothetical protein
MSESIPSPVVPELMGQTVVGPDNLHSVVVGRSSL